MLQLGATAEPGVTFQKDSSACWWRLASQRADTRRKVKGSTYVGRLSLLIPAPFLLRLLVRRVEPIAVGSPPIVFYR